jgi:hypothetical protein
LFYKTLHTRLFYQKNKNKTPPKIDIENENTSEKFPNKKGHGIVKNNAVTLRKQ